MPDKMINFSLEQTRKIYADETDRVERFVERCESFMAEETSEWKKSERRTCE